VRLAGLPDSHHLARGYGSAAVVLRAAQSVQGVCWGGGGGKQHNAMSPWLLSGLLGYAGPTTMPTTTPVTVTMRSHSKLL
jgi:hypothetical protein